jgi:ABC-2 type transport system ATP-binding protein
MGPDQAAIQVERLLKSYGSTTAVDCISFTVDAGEVFGLLGPNGAGKTTTVECIEGLRTPDGGTIHVLGLDVGRDLKRLKQRIGVPRASAVSSPSRSCSCRACSSRSTSCRTS